MKPIATMGITNVMGIAVYSIEYGIEEKIVFRWECIDSKPTRMSKAKIRYDRQGNTYFVTHGMSIYLQDLTITESF